MLIVIMLSFIVIMINVITLNVVMLSVVAPLFSLSVANDIKQVG
jgi:hypothetical protein